jgi:hypothetical protein
MNTIRNSGTNQPPVVVPGGFSIYDVTTGNSNQDGYWITSVALMFSESS